MISAVAQVGVDVVGRADALGSPEGGRGASDARLITRYQTDPLMGGTGMNVNFVTLEV